MDWKEKIEEGMKLIKEGCTEQTECRKCRDCPFTDFCDLLEGEPSEEF